MFLNYLISQIDKSYSPKGFSNSEAVNIQFDIFKNLLRKSKNTKFGIDHNFNKIDNYEKYKLNVPIRDYEDFKIYINHVREGKEDITWPGRPLYFAKTSGTTSGTKFIPITKESLPNHINSAKHLLYNYYLKKKKIKPFLGKVMFLSGSPDLEEKNQIKIGRLSGIVNHHKPLLLKKKSLPNKKTNQIQNWEKKIDQIAEETIGRDLRIIGGIPPWIQMFFDIIIEKTGKKINQIFPNLDLICHGGVNFEPYKKNLFNSIGKEIDTLETYPASEGFFAYQNDIDSEDLLLQINSGIFYEFVEVNELKNKDPRRISIKDVKLDTNYALIISSNAGLWSYNIGDTIKFTNLNPFKIRVSGRTKQFISAFGEHVIVEDVEISLKITCQKFREVEITEYTVGPKIIDKRSKSHHEWLIEFKTPPKNMSEFEKEIDKNMQKRNIYYKDLINDKVISRLKVNQAKKKSFINFMKSIGKLGGQNKVPRISNDNSIIEKIKKIN